MMSGCVIGVEEVHVKVRLLHNSIILVDCDSKG